MFCVKSEDRRVLKAAKHAMFLFEDANFLTIIASEYYTHTDLTAKHIAKLIINWVKENDIIIGTYKPWYWRSRAQAKFSPKTPDHIYLSERRLTRYADERLNSASLAGSILHEIVHLVDHKYKEYTFGHGKGWGANNPTGKENSAPYRIGREAKKHIMRYL